MASTQENEAPPARITVEAAVVAPVEALVETVTNEPTVEPTVATESSRAARTTRIENIVSDELTPAEIEALFRAQYSDTPPKTSASVGSTAVMNKNDMDDLLQALGENVDEQRYHWLPQWAATPTAAAAAPSYHGRSYNEDEERDNPSEVDDFVGEESETHTLIRELEVSIATIDDTTVATRDRMIEVADDVKSMQTQLSEMEDALGAMNAQNVALTEEMGELRTTTLALRNSITTLVNLVRQLLRLPTAAAATAATTYTIVPATVAAAPAAVSEDIA